MADATPAVSPLRRRMIDDMTLRNLSPATQRSYLYAVAKFARYFDRSPDQLGLEDVRAFQVYLVSQGISWPSLNQTVCALRFFYGVTLNRAEIPERIAYARAALTTAYAAGLRASEAVSLKVAGIDSDRMVLQVRHGKGAKDRTVMLSPQLLGILRTYWRLAQPRDWLFPGRGDKPIDVQVLHSACRSATKAAGLTKKVSVHTLRHSFATHVWMPPSMQAVSERFEHVIGCGHVSGLELRHWSWPRAGMAIRRSEADHFHELSGSLGDPALSDLDLIDHLPLLFINLLTPPTYRSAAS